MGSGFNVNHRLRKTCKYTRNRIIEFSDKMNHVFSSKIFLKKELFKKSYRFRSIFLTDLDLILKKGSQAKSLDILDIEIADHLELNIIHINMM